MSAEFFDFVQIVKRNLSKNGFPGNPVAFGLEKLYEEADKRGFSFNKVRESLKAEGIESELTDEKVIFRAATAESSHSAPDADMAAMAQEILGKMSQEEREKIMKMMQEMDPEMLKTARQQWESMSADDKRRAMEEMKKAPR